jgi:hypothetical protein
VSTGCVQADHELFVVGDHLVVALVLALDLLPRHLELRVQMVTVPWWVRLEVRGQVWAQSYPALNTVSFDSTRS